MSDGRYYEDDKTLLRANQYPETLIYRKDSVFKFMLLSDIHIGAAGFDRKRFDRWVSERYDDVTAILINGDVLDLLLIKDIKRYVPSVVASELQGRDDLYDAAIEYAASVLKPYASKIVMIGEGNHEATILKYHSSNPVNRLINELGVPAVNGGYWGYYRFQFAHRTESKRTCNSFPLIIHYNHGKGGNAPVTKGIIDFNRFCAMAEDFDVLWLGHKHNSLSDNIMRMSMSQRGVMQFRRVTCVMTPSFVAPISSRFAEERGFTPNPIGGAIIKVSFRRDHFKTYMDTELTH